MEDHFDITPKNIVLLRTGFAAHSEHHFFQHLPPNSARTGYATEGAPLYLRAAAHWCFQRKWLIMEIMFNNQGQVLSKERQVLNKAQQVLKTRKGRC